MKESCESLIVGIVCGREEREKRIDLGLLFFAKA